MWAGRGIQQSTGMVNPFGPGFWSAGRNHSRKTAVLSMALPDGCRRPQMVGSCFLMPSQMMSEPSVTLNRLSDVPIERSVAALRARVSAWRKAGESVALVPTMGALHDGHLALVDAAKSRAKRVVVSIFVNPRQFAPSEDFASYPRREAEDAAKLADRDADAIFAPPALEMYPTGEATSVVLAGPALGLESDFRPHFFAGVATVVTKLLLAALPDIAIFGEKDYQQLAVIRRMATDLLIPVEIVGHPTIREPDGLAFSSRNAYLAPAERRIAPNLHAVLDEVAGAIRAGRDAAGTINGAAAKLRGIGFKVDYLELRNAETLQPVGDIQAEPLRLLVAAWLGKTRLIDNIAV
jgi:pantoate--beta-alanine ligase